MSPPKIAGRFVPGELTVGEADQQRVDRVVLEPIRDFLVDPFGSGGFRRSEEDKMTRLPERLLDRRPEVRRGSEAGVVAEQPQRPAPVPRLTELLDCRLQCRGNRLVLGVAVRNERVIGGHGANPVT